MNAYEVGASDARPWGEWRVVDAGPAFAVKRITVRPGARLSLQRHAGRDEHWVVVAGHARVTRGSQVFDLLPNGSAFIPAPAVHRVECVGPEPLVFVEVQVGAHLSEDDIERLEDAYGRAPQRDGASGAEALPGAGPPAA